MVTLAEAASPDAPVAADPPAHGHVRPRALAGRVSLMRMGLATRLALAAGAAATLWSAIALGLS